MSLRRFEFSDDAVERAVLVTSELVAHAFAAGRPPIRIRVRSIADGRAMVEVTHGVDDEPADEGVAEAIRLQLTPAARAVVDTVAERWGVRPSGTGVMAWFEVGDGEPILHRRRDDVGSLLTRRVSRLG